MTCDMTFKGDEIIMINFLLLITCVLTFARISRDRYKDKRLQIFLCSLFRVHIYAHTQRIEKFSQIVHT